MLLSLRDQRLYADTVSKSSLSEPFTYEVPFSCLAPLSWEVGPYGLSYTEVHQSSTLVGTLVYYLTTQESHDS